MSDKYALAYNTWQEKTEWVQTDKRFDVLLPWGKHRADILKEYIEHIEAKLDEALRYGRQADATIHNLELKLTDMAVQLANAESKCRKLSSKAMELVCEASLVYSKYNDTQMPDRDLVDMQTLQEMHDLCKGAAL